MKPAQQKHLRKGRFSSTNQIYHITTTTLCRKPIFNDLKYARILINVLKDTDAHNYTNTLAFIIMPDHIHWLFELHNSKTLAQVMQAVKSISAKQIGQPIWQTGFYDHAIRKDEDIQHIARYIIANPIRAGITKKVGDYPHWDAIWL